MFKTPHLILNMQFGLAQNELYWHTLSRLKKIQGCDWYLLEIRLLWWQHFGTVGLAAACYGCIPLCGSVQVPVSLFPGHLSANPSEKQQKMARVPVLLHSNGGHRAPVSRNLVLLQSLWPLGKWIRGWTVCLSALFPLSVIVLLK